MTPDGSVLLMVGEALTPETVAGLEGRGLRITAVPDTAAADEFSGKVMACVFLPGAGDDPFLALATLKRRFPTAAPCAPR